MFDSGKLVRFYNFLKDLYDNDDKDMSFLVTPTYHKTKDLLFKKYFENDIMKYPNLELYLFLVFYSHNTSDSLTYRVFKKIDEAIQNGQQLNFEKWFYKRKTDYTKALYETADYIRNCEKNNLPLTLSELIKIRYVGFKSASIILDHLEEAIYPIIDINAHHSFNIITKADYSADQIFKIVCKLPELTNDEQSAYHMSLWLWKHRKICRLFGPNSVAPHCYGKKSRESICGYCEDIRNKYNDMENKIDKS